jgi:hypothetical protein
LQIEENAGDLPSILSVVLEEKILEKVYDDNDANGRQMIAIAHLDLRPRRAKTKLIVKIYMKKVEI